MLDFDDTYQPGLAHLSAPCAPAALALAADLDRSVGDALDAFAAGFEAMGALARASHPALYDRGWHPTAVCGGVGAAVAAAQLLGLGDQRRRAAVDLGLLRAGGLRAAFGSDGKSLQVGMAAATGVHAARVVAGGASISADVAAGPAGFSAAFGTELDDSHPDRPAIADNWLKPWPCCLMAHSAIEAASTAREQGIDVAGNAITVTVHPRAREAAAYDEVADGLQAKFSIPYLVAHTLLLGEPGVASFSSPDPRAQELAARRLSVRTDPALGETAAILSLDDERIASVEHSVGSPERPMSVEHLAAKTRDLAGARLDGALDDRDQPAADLLAAAGLAKPTGSG